MLRVRHALAAVLGLSMCFPLCFPFPAFAEVAVGEATLIKTEVAGENGPLVVKDPVHRDERIRTSIGGLGQFVFRDGTKLAVGAGSSVVIDSYVYDDENSVKKLTIKAAKGTFRWISGNSSSSAYSIVTPAGTIGVRGTAFDVYVAPNGTTAMVLLNGSAQFCGAGGCKQLRQQCDCVIASRRGGVSDPRTVDEQTLRSLKNQKALPFLSGSQELSGPLGNIRTTCGLRSIKLDPRDPQRQIAPKATPIPAPQAPQQVPEPPQKPDKAHHHHRHDHHWGGWHDRHHAHWGGRRDGWGDRDGGWGQRSDNEPRMAWRNQRGGQPGGRHDRADRDRRDGDHRGMAGIGRGAGKGWHGDHQGRRDRQQASREVALGGQMRGGPGSDGTGKHGPADVGSPAKVSGHDAHRPSVDRHGWHGDKGKRDLGKRDLGKHDQGRRRS